MPRKSEKPRVKKARVKKAKRKRSTGAAGAAAGASSSKVKRSKLTLDERIGKEFDKYADDDGVLEDRMLDFLEDLGVEPDDKVVLVLCQMFKCKQGGMIRRSEWEHGMRLLKCGSVSELSSRLDYMRSMLALPENFHSIYRYAFSINLEPPKKLLERDTAIALWELLFDTDSFVLLNEWVAFVQTNGPKLISKDVFFQVQLFAKQFGQDLSAWEDDGAWPILIDDFVEHMNEKGGN